MSVATAAAADDQPHGGGLYEAVNAAVLARVPAGTSTLLDLGCGTGAFGAAAKAATGCSVVGVTFSAGEAQRARLRLDRVEVADLDGFDPTPLGKFDCVVCSHVLEHLLAPEQALARLRPCLWGGGTLVVALPNVLFWKQRLQFLRGRFRYEAGGLMDRTHYRFFDWQSAAEMIEGAGFAIVERFADGAFPLSARLGATLSKVVDRHAIERLPGLFGHQFVFRCMPA